MNYVKEKLSLERMEIANPSDKATIDCTDILACRIAVALLGGGKYGLIKKSGETDMPPFIFGGHDEWFEENHGMSFVEALNKTSKIAIADALDSIELVYERTSINDFVGRAHDMAEQLRNTAHANSLNM